MSTIAVLKTKVTTNIPDNAGIGSNPAITPEKHREVENAIIDELKLRGVLFSATTAGLANIPGTDTDMVFVPGRGFFRFAPGLIANGVTIFAALTTGFWQLQKLIFPKERLVVASANNIALDTDAADIFHINIAHNTDFGAPTGTLWEGKRIEIRIKQTGAGSFQPTWNPIFAWSDTYFTPDFTGHDAGWETKIVFEYNADALKWDAVNVVVRIDRN